MHALNRTIVNAAARLLANAAHFTEHLQTIAGHVDFASFSRDVQTFKAKFGGTPPAVQAAELLMKFRSPLDKLDPAKLAQDILEEYKGRGEPPPKELVAVFG